MSLGGDDWTKLNIYSSIGRSSDGTPPSRCLTIYNASTAVCVDGPSLKVLASFACCGTSVGEMRIFRLWVSVGGSSDAGLQACVSFDMSPGMRERRQK